MRGLGTWRAPVVALLSRRAVARWLIGLVAATALQLAHVSPAFADPLWSSVPSPFACSATSNACLEHTGFNPNVSYWGQYTNAKGNCTNYVAYRVGRNGGTQLSGSGDAITWKNRVASQFGAAAVDNTPAVGALGWWGTSKGASGHVAYVERVEGSAVYISESSFNIGSARYVKSPGQSGYPEAFLHIKDDPVAGTTGVSDFTGDSKADLVYQDPGATEIRVLSSAGAVAAGQSAWASGFQTSAWRVVGDMTGDGRADVVYQDSGSSTFYLLESTGSGFSHKTWATGFTQPAWQRSGDFTGDGKADIAYQDPGSTDIRVLTSAGATAAGQGSWAAGFALSAWRVAGDFTGDGRADIVYQDPGSTTLYLLASTGSGFSHKTWATGFQQATWQQAGDFNGDGKADIAYQDPGSTDIRVLTSAGDAASGQSSWAAGFQLSAVRAAGDFDGDARADLVYQDPGSSTFYLLSSTGSGFSHKTWATGFQQPGWMCASAGNPCIGAPPPSAPPSDTTAPSATLSPLSSVTKTASPVIAYSGSDAGSGLKSFDVRYVQAAYSGAFGGWNYPSSWQGVTARSVSSPIPAGYAQCFSVRARDSAGNVSGWSALKCTSRPLDDVSLTSAGFTRSTSSSYFLGTYSYTARSGATLSKAGVVAKRFGVVAQTCPTCGSIAVYAGSTKLGTISLVSSTTKYQQLLMLPVRSSVLTGTVSVRVTSSSKPVRLDGLAVSRV